MNNIINYILEEDEGFSDITSNALIDEDHIVSGKIISKDEGIAAGMDIVYDLFDKKGIEITKLVEDGTLINKGDVLFELVGNTRDILLLERTALNISMRMSGVATSTYNINKKVHNINPNIRIAGTRKTSPAFAKFDKEAILIGGGDTHRFALDDMVLIKDNHIAAVGSLEEALKRAIKNTSFTKKIEIEVENIDDAVLVAQMGADIVMLDNFTPENVSKCINKLTELNLRGKILIEVSGGINENNILDYAGLDIDIISIGALTHSSKSLDFSLRIDKVKF